MSKTLKLSGLLILFGFLFLQGKTQNTDLSKKISISFENVTIRQAIQTLHDSTKISFSYNSELAEFDRRITHDFKFTAINDILDKILENSGLAYRVIGNQVTLYKKPQTGSINLNEAAGEIRGRVLDQNTGSPLPFVNVALEGTTLGAVTDASGNFQIKELNPDYYTLVTSFIGYTPAIVQDILVKESAVYDVGTLQLKESAVSLNEVVITPGSFSVMGSIPLSQQTITEKDIKYMSYSEDVSRAVSRLPGVASNDYSSKFTVRGGETDEVLITLDGMELYEPFHQRDFVGGLFSVVDIEAVSGLELLTGGFSADYGNKQSAVFNMTTKEARESRPHGIIGLSVVNAGIFLNGKTKNEKTSYLISARRGMLDQSLKILGETENVPVYYDGLARITHKFNNKHSLSFHLLTAGDKTQVRDITEEAYDIHDTKYFSGYSWITLSSIYNSKLSSRSIVYAANINQERNGNTKKYEYSDKMEFKLTDNRDYTYYGIKQDWKWITGNWIILKSGFDFRASEATYDYSLNLNDIRVNAEGEVGPYSISRTYEGKPTGTQIGIYVSTKLMPLKGFYLEPGLRYDQVSWTGDKNWSPRLSAAYSLSKKTTLRAAWGYYYQSQYINNLEVNFGVNSFYEAELAKHYVLGIEHQTNSGLNIRIEGYYKDISLPTVSYQNVRDAFEVFPEVRSDLAKLYLSGARAKGIELFVKYDMGKKFSYWFSYSLAKAEENVDSIQFDGLLEHRTGWLRRISNQNHTINADVIYRPKKSWVINLSWQFWNDWPLTTYHYEFTYLENGDLHFYPNHHGFRDDSYTPYHRMDLRVNKRFQLRKGFLNAYIHIINLYNRENLRKFDVDVRNDQEQLIPDGNGGYETFQSNTYWFGITPVFGINWEF